MTDRAVLWVAFNVFIVILLALDLGVFHKKNEAITIRQALLWSLVWICLALLFNVGIYFTQGSGPALQYLTCYLLEKSLSVDNVFVFLMVFTYFRVPAEYQRRVLFFGIFGALVMRAVFIAMGVTLVQRFHWIIYVFGAFLVYTGYKFARGGAEEIDPEKNPALKLLRRIMPISNEYSGSRFFVRQGGRLLATPLFVTLLVVEMSDIVFAVDSIPAALAITQDAFIIYSANVFAILGLRALFFAIAGLLRLFHYLHYGLAFILAFVGAKMLLSHIYKVPILVTLGVLVGVLTISVLASIWHPKPVVPEETQ